MRRTSLAKAKAQLAQLVTAAEQHRECIVIVRNGIPTAAIVPVDVALPAIAGRGRWRRRGRPLSAKRIDELFAAFRNTRPRHGAVSELIANRR